MAAHLARGLVQRARGDERGSALLVVLLLLGLIAALASVVARSVSGAALTVAAARAAAQTQADLRAGMELGAATILRLGEDLRSADAAVDLTDRRITVRVTNERARIDLNAASAPVLTQLLKSNGVPDEAAETLAANIIEWRSGPATHAQTASITAVAASPASAASGPKPGKAARYFLHPWQLASVPGFSPALVKALSPVVTVANGSDQIDPFIASGGVLRSLPEASPDSVDAFLSARGGNTSRETAIKLLGVPKKLLTADPSIGWRIEIAAQMRDGRVRRGEAVIAIVSGDSTPYRVVYLLDDQGQPSPSGM